MSFFRFPYSTFNQVNLDWIMRTIKKLEPAATMVEEADATLQEAQQTAAAAQATATAAQTAVNTVTTQAAEAVETAEQALEVAQQAASATIADGSVTKVKLSEELQDEIDTAGTTASNALSAAGVAQQIGNQAQQAASNAGSDAALALVNAENARQVGVSAQSTADQARTAAAAAQATADQALAAAGTGASWSYLTTLDSSDGTAKSATLPLATKEVMILIWDTFSSSYRSSIYMPAAAFPTGAQTGYWCNSWHNANGSLVSKQLYVRYNNGVVIQTNDMMTGCAIYYR